MTTPTIPAATRVLTTAELLENILHHLPPASLLRAQGCCRLFHALISTSPLLQSDLFFRYTAQSSKSNSTTNSFALNPILVSAFPEWFQSALDESKHQPSPYQVYRENLPPGIDGRDVLKESEHIFHRLPWTTRREEFKSKEASWRRMLISNPPIRKIEFRKENSSETGTSFEVAMVTIPREGENCESDASLKTVNGPLAYSTSEAEAVLRGERDVEEDMATRDERWRRYVEMRSALYEPQGEEEVLQDEGLRMGVLYDYVEEAVGSMKVKRPYSVTFEFEVWKRGRLSPSLLGRDDASNETILRVTLSYFHGCLYEEDVPMHDFHSDGFQKVVVGPWFRRRGGD
ncbi:hypothetical protein BU16DRAFT_583909 [Lophium mytilinum]|uniref:F-box domain-containing protein n=1 Tax=Lophium mytilinum TaxID=390894 RepID=A0A6A6QKS5_9PEZI|nr:hypothetical protein BU16DRAFT_583909 [Lophium mytilinum]